MSATITPCFEVVGVFKGREMVMRRFAEQDRAIAHALRADLNRWEDVFVRPGTKSIPDRPTEPPPRPWSVLWVGGHAYIVAANGAKIASLLGTLEQREFVAAIITEMMGEPTRELEAAQ